jgi:hypothetical protein
MVAPEVRYARSGELSIAYQVVGEGASALVYATAFWQSIETQWLEPRFEAFLWRLASFSRLILCDYRGTGLSDPTASLLPPLEEWMEDLRVVLDAVGWRKAALIGSGGGGFISMVERSRTQGGGSSALAPVDRSDEPRHEALNDDSGPSEMAAASDRIEPANNIRPIT